MIIRRLMYASEEGRLVGRSADCELPIIDSALVRRLVDSQFPQWTALPLTLLDPAGSDHVIYRLGGELAVRLPRHRGPMVAARKEAVWLPRLARHLPLRIPVQEAVGEPGFGYPWPWSVTRWLPGEVATNVPELADSDRTAQDLASFLMALEEFPAEQLWPDKISAGLVTGDPLATGDRRIREGIAQAEGSFPADALIDLWDAALAARQLDRPRVWIHGDFHAGNLLAMDGRISAVIDFSAIGIGDPACDFAVAFGLMSRRVRKLFRRTLGADEATWTRARGLAVAGGLIAYTSYGADNPRLAEQTARQIMDALDG